jgi:hypothetical protein
MAGLDPAINLPAATELSGTKLKTLHFPSFFAACQLLQRG